MKKHFVWLVLCTLAVTCVTSIDNVPRYVSPLATVLVEDVEKYIAERRVLDALALIDRLKREKNDIAGERLEELRKTSVDGAVVIFQEMLSAKNFPDARAIYQSLKNIKEESRVSDWTGQRLLLARAEQLEGQGEMTQALIVYQRALRGGTLSREQYGHIGDLAVKNNNTAACELVVSEMERRGLDVPPSFKSLETPSVTKMINGTVTMWVNKGVKIEKGVGMLDRVIGSGFFIDPRGYLLTNYHVIESEVNPKYEGYSRLFVRLSEKPEQKIPARVVGYDPVFDIALVKVEIEPKYTFSSIRESAVELGEKIRVIGSPVGLENTITSGIISATGRRFLQMGDALQIDAPVNPGNSGGPVIDENGKLIGIVFAGIEQFEGINFAVSSEWIGKLIPRLFQGNQVKHVWMGMALAETEQGLEVIYVVPGEPADNAGIRTGDIFLALNDRQYAKIRDFQSALVDYEGTTLVTLNVRRAGNEFVALISLDERPRVPITLALKRDSRVNVIFPLFGMKIEKVSDSFLSPRYIVRKVLTGSMAEELGLSENDPIDIRGWVVDEEHRIVGMEVKVQRRKLGFLETFIQIFSFLEIDSFV